MAVSPLIAVLEDDNAAADALTIILEDWGAEVVKGAEAQEVITVLGPRLGDVSHIITDFHLGDGPDGVSLVRALASVTPNARVLVLSGSFHGRASAAAARAGFDVMQKPARAEAIVAWLERH